MAKLPEPVNRTAAAIYARYKRNNEDWRRPHLGASIIGSECMRHLWYSFRWASDPDFEGRLLRLFERGQREEEWIVQELRLLGIQVETEDKSQAVDLETKKHPQYRFAEVGGHFGGSCDGVALGVLEAPKTWHLLEVKTANDRLFKLMQKNGVAKAEPKHVSQMQCYMHGLKLKRCLYVCVNKNTDAIYTERVYYDRKLAEATIRIAEGIIRAPEPLSKISEDPSWFECKFCDHRPICHMERPEFLERNCRTCLSSTPLDNGEWVCGHHLTTRSVEEQRAGCDDHLFIPALLPWWTPVAVDDEKRLITYVNREGTNMTDTGSGLIGVS